MALAIGSPLSLHQIARECRCSAKKLRGGVVAPLTFLLFGGAVSGGVAVRFRTVRMARSRAAPLKHKPRFMDGHIRAAFVFRRTLYLTRVILADRPMRYWPIMLAAVLSFAFMVSGAALPHRNFLASLRRSSSVRAKRSGRTNGLGFDRPLEFGLSRLKFGQLCPEISNLFAHGSQFRLGLFARQIF